MGLPRMLVPLWRVQYWLARGDMGRVSAWIEETLPVFDDPHPMANIHLPFLKVTLARALLAVGQVDTADRILAQLRADPRCVRQTDLCLYLFILQALVYQARGDIPAALEQLELALSTGEKEGYIRIFVDEGPAVAGLLLRLVDQLRQRDPAPLSPSPAYLQRLLDAFGVQADLPPAPIPAPDGLFVEPLTEREQEILQLLAAGLSNDEIAERLVIARSTLKTHLKNIYGKLDAHSRLEAVARAKELSLL
ncbi:MAG: hypothetical protein D6681_15050 [Calditrichaeota bacterium]|nr:MAG: hypothetical protein D6681_15050 [Calditrichota bacterium]